MGNAGTTSPANYESLQGLKGTVKDAMPKIRGLTGKASPEQTVVQLKNEIKKMKNEMHKLKGHILELTLHNPNLLPKDTYSLPILIYNSARGGQALFPTLQQRWPCPESCDITKQCGRLSNKPMASLVLPVLGIVLLAVWIHTEFVLSGIAMFLLVCLTLFLIWLMCPLIFFCLVAVGMALLQAFSMRAMVDVTQSWCNVQMADNSLRVLVLALCVLLCAACANDTRDSLSLIHIGWRAASSSKERGCRNCFLAFMCFAFGGLQLLIIVNLTQLSASILTSMVSAQEVILNYMQLQLLVRLDNTVVQGALFAIPPQVWEFAGFELEKQELEDMQEDEEQADVAENGTTDVATPLTDSVNFKIDNLVQGFDSLQAEKRMLTYGNMFHALVMSLPFFMCMVILQEQATIGFQAVDVRNTTLGMCNVEATGGIPLVPIMDNALCEGATRQIFHVDKVARGDQGDGPCVYMNNRHKLGKSILELSFDSKQRATDQLCVPEFIRVPMTSFAAFWMNFAPSQRIPYGTEVTDNFPIVDLPPNGVCAANDLDWIKTDAECAKAQRLLDIETFNASWKKVFYALWLPNWHVSACLGFDNNALVTHHNDPLTPVVVCKPFQCTRVTDTLTNLTTYQTSIGMQLQEL